MNNEELSNFAIRLKCNLQERGYTILDPHEFFNGIDALYRKPSIEHVLAEEIPQIVAEDALFFEKHQIDLPLDITAHLRKHYGTNPQLRRQYIDVVDRVSYSAKVWLRHMRYFLVNNPDAEELAHAVSEFKAIISGRFQP